MEFNFKTQELTESNYYDNEMNWHYLSTSLYKSFKSCQAKALAELKQEYTSIRDPVPLLVGNYVHSYFEGEEAHQKFISDNEKAILSSRGATKGQPKADYKIADNMIDKLKGGDFFNNLYTGEKEVIIKGEIFGQKWKGKIDCLHFAKNNNDINYFVDLKTTQEINKKFWDSENRTWVSFIESYEYILQMAIYQELLLQEYGILFQPFIIAVSKQTPPNIEAIMLDSLKDDFQGKLDEVEALQPEIIEVISGKAKPVSCNKCDYCRENKQLTQFVSVSSLV